MKEFLFSLVLSVLVSMPALSTTIELKSLNKKIKDFQQVKLYFRNVVARNVSSVDIVLTLNHKDAGDLEITLVSPKGKKFVLARNLQKRDRNFKLFFTEDSPELKGILGIEGDGEWNIFIKDLKENSDGRVLYAFFRVDEDESQVFIDNSILLTSVECSEKWETYLDSVTLDKRYQKLEGYCGDDFKRRLRNIISARHFKTSYRAARQFMFSKLDNVTGEVCGVYTNECLRTKGIPNNTKMNCEHTWPKSKGASGGMAKYDLHHLFPTKSDINSIRSSYPFCEVISKETGRAGSSLGRDRQNSRCFEPKDNHKGDVARSMFYFSIRYSLKIDTVQEAYFHKWSLQDPVNEHEFQRDLLIETFQGNRNPFVIHPGLTQFVLDF